MLPITVAVIFSLVDLVIYSSAYLFHALAVRDFPLDEALTTASYALFGRVFYFGWPLQLFALWLVQKYISSFTNVLSIFVCVVVFVGIGSMTLGGFPTQSFTLSLNTWNLAEGVALLCGLAASIVLLHLLRRRSYAT
ncbi:MAG: hypothetical protein AAF098_12125 [Pseudomonadota bacterium]